MPQQAAGMSRYSVAEEITSFCADFLVVDVVYENRSPCKAGSLVSGEKQGDCGFEPYFPAFPDDKRQVIQCIAGFFADGNKQGANRAYQGGCHAYQRCASPNPLRE